MSAEMPVSQTIIPFSEEIEVEGQREGEDVTFEIKLPQSDLTEGVRVFGIYTSYNHAGRFKELTWGLIMRNLDSYGGGVNLHEATGLVEWRVSSCDKPRLDYKKIVGEPVDYDRLQYKFMSDPTCGILFYIARFPLMDDVDNPFLRVRDIYLSFPQMADLSNPILVNHLSSL